MRVHARVVLRACVCVCVRVRTRVCVCNRDSKGYAAKDGPELLIRQLRLPCGITSMYHPEGLFFKQVVCCVITVVEMALCVQFASYFTDVIKLKGCFLCYYSLCRQSLKSYLNDNF